MATFESPRSSMPPQEPVRTADAPRADAREQTQSSADVRAVRPAPRTTERVAVGQEVERLRAQLTAEQRRRRTAPINYEWPFMNSTRMHAVKDMVERVAGTDATVLVWGESGVGKDLVTRAIHD